MCSRLEAKAQGTFGHEGFTRERTLDTRSVCSHPSLRDTSSRTEGFRVTLPGAQVRQHLHRSLLAPFPASQAGRPTHHHWQTAGHDLELLSWSHSVWHRHRIRYGIIIVAASGARDGIRPGILLRLRTERGSDRNETRVGFESKGKRREMEAGIMHAASQQALHMRHRRLTGCKNASVAVCM